MRFISGFIIITCFGLLVSCGQRKIVVDGLTQGTSYHIAYFDSSGVDYSLEIDSLLKHFDTVASIYNPASMLSKLNNSNILFEPDSMLLHILSRAIEISELTGGAFDITVGPLVNAWGFGLKNREKIDSTMIDSLRQFVGYQLIEIEDNIVLKKDPRITLDLNAIAQGYSVDLVARFLETKGIKNYIVEIGGEVYAKGHKKREKPWMVGIEKPAETAVSQRELKAKAMLRDKALASSGSYRKFYEENGVKYSHTIDPFTGYPVKHSLLSVSVIARDCMTADALATAFMVMGTEKTKSFLKEHPWFEVYMIYAKQDGSLETFLTPGFKKLIVEEF